MHACFKFVSLIIYISIFFTQEIVIFLFYTLYTYPVISTKSVSFFLLYLECMLTRNQYLCLIYMVSIFNKIPHMFYMLKICYCFHLWFLISFVRLRHLHLLITMLKQFGLFIDMNFHYFITFCFYQSSRSKRDHCQKENKKSELNRKDYHPGFIATPSPCLCIRHWNVFHVLMMMKGTSSCSWRGNRWPTWPASVTSTPTSRCRLMYRRRTAFTGKGR